MIPGRLFVVVWNLAVDVVGELAGSVDRVLDRLAGAPPVSDELADALDAFQVAGPGKLVSLPIETDVIGPDEVHHGCWTLHVCAVNNTATVVPLSGFTCPICDSSPAASPAGDRPAAVSDGFFTTAPAAGHPNPLRDAADADARIVNRLNNFIAKRWR